MADYYGSIGGSGGGTSAGNIVAGEGIVATVAEDVLTISCEDATEENISRIYSEFICFTHIWNLYLNCLNVKRKIKERRLAIHPLTKVRGFLAKTL